MTMIPGNQAAQDLYDDGAVLTGSIGLLLNGRCVKRVNNLVVDSGKNLICERLEDNTVTVPTHVAIGTSNTAPAAGQTTLGAEAHRKSVSSTAVVANTIQWTANFAPGEGTGAIIEAGLFNAGVGGTMLCRTLFSGVITKGAGDTLGVVWTLTVS